MGPQPLALRILSQLQQYVMGPNNKLHNFVKPLNGHIGDSVLLSHLIFQGVSLFRPAERMRY